MRWKLYFIILWMAVGLFSSCVSYRVLDVEVLEPAVVHLERGSRLAFFDRNAEGRENIIRFAEPSVRRELTVEFGRGMDYQLLQAGLDTVLLLGNYQEEKVDSLSAQPPLVRDSVWAICSRFGLDCLVSLEAVFYDYRQGDIHCRWLLRLYDGYEGIPVDLIVLEDSFPEEEFGGDSYALVELLSVLYWDAGARYAQRLVPSWLETQRRIYRRGKVLGLGDVFLRNERVKEAEALWEQVASLPDKTGVQACINLAWIAESREDFVRAQEWLLRAEDLAGQGKVEGKTVAYLQEYLRLLEKRIAQRKLLESQIDLYE